MVRKPLDHVEAEQKRDLHPALFHGHMLQRPDESRIGGPQDGTGFPAAHVILNTDRVLRKEVAEFFPLVRFEIKSAHLGQLSDLLVQAHPGKKSLDTGVHLLARGGRALSRRTGRRQRKSEKQDNDGAVGIRPCIDHWGLRKRGILYDRLQISGIWVDG